MANMRQKFHPSVILLYFIRDIRKWLFLIILIWFDLNNRGTYSIIGLSALFLLIFTRSLIHYMTHRYTVTAEHVVVYKGVFKKKETEISYDRMQTVKQKQWFFFKPFNVVEVLIETASTSPGEAEASLTAVDYSLLETIEGFRNKTKEKDKTDDSESTQPEIVYQLFNREIVHYALTDLTVVLVLGTVALFIYEWLPTSAYASLASMLVYFEGNLRILLIFMGIGTIGAVSLLKNFVRFYNYRATRNDDTLTIEYGLFERRTQKISLDKIQGIKIHKQLFRSLFKRSSVELSIMSGQENKGDGLNARKVYLFPLIKNNHLHTQLAHLLPTLKIVEPDITLVSKKRLWYFWRFKLLIGTPIIIMSFQFNGLLSVGLVIALIAFLIAGWLKSQVQGYAIQSNSLICFQTFQGLSTVQLFIKRHTIQAFKQSTTIWLSKKELGHVTLSYKEGDLVAESSLMFIPQTDASDIYEHFWHKNELQIPLKSKPSNELTIESDT